MHVRQKKLLDFLRDCERRNRTFTPEDADEASGYTHGTVHTYITKGLLGPWVARSASSARYRVAGAIGTTPEAFGRAMSQKSARKRIETLDEWREELQSLLEIGLDCSFPVQDVMSEILERCQRDRTAR